jgi:phenylacetate-CoA ligase
MSIDDRLHSGVSAYMGAPQWVKTIAGGAYSLLPKQLRHGRSYDNFRNIFSSSTCTPSYVHNQLAKTLKAAAQGVPAFASLGRHLDDIETHPRQFLEGMPLISKEDIKSNLDSFVNRNLPEGSRLKMFTGGSTSVPMTFYGQVGISRAKELAAFDTLAARFDTEGDGIILALRGRTVPSATRSRIWMYEPIKRHLILSSDHLEARFMAQYVKALQRWRPRYIQAFPSALYPLVLWLRHNGYESVLSGVRCVTLVSESVFEHHLEAFKEFFSCPVLVTYGHTERVLLANTLPDDPRYHFWPRYGYFQLIDSAGHTVTKAGQVGEIVGTSFDNLVMPFIRYRTGDYAVLGQAPHPSMHDSPVVERIEGRLQEFVVCSDHRLITVTTIGAAHVQELERCFRIQYEQFQPGRLILRVVAMEPLDASSKARVCRAIEHKTQGGCSVEINEVAHIELTGRGKQRLLIQHLDISRYLGAAMSAAGSTRACIVSDEVTTVASEVGTSGGAMQAVVEELFASGRLSDDQLLLMVGTSGKTQGGIASVVNTYRDGGLFELVPTQYVVTHCDGSSWRKAGQFVKAIGETTLALVCRRVALVHAHVSSGASFWRKSILLLAARAAGVPTIFHLHSGGFSKWVERLGASSLSARWIRHTLERSNEVIALNRSTASWLSEFAPNAFVNVMGNPIIVPRLVESGGGNNADCSDGGTVLYLGWIYDFKGCYDLLRAWSKFRQVCPGWRLSVGGKGEVDRFLSEAELLGIREDIDFLGWVSGQAKEDQLRHADILVLPSYHEGMPMSVLEGMAHGLPIAATPVGGVAEMMVPGLHGLWMKPGDIEGISECLVTLAKSPDLRARMGRAAHEHIKTHNSIESILEQLLAVYRRVLESKQSKPVRSV